MPDITFAHTFTSGAAADPANAMRNLYTPYEGATPPSPEVINGGLDDDNLPAGRVITRRHIQPDAFAMGGEVGSNASLDYFGEMFETTLSADGISTADTTADFVPIPGANVALHVPWPSTEFWLMFSWNISWLTDGKDAGEVAAIRFGLIEPGQTAPVFFSSQRRVIPQTIRSESGNLVWRASTKQQRWNGHHAQTGASGWWSAGLYLAADCTQTRLYARSIRWAALRRSVPK